MNNPDDYWRHQSPAPPHAPPNTRGLPGAPLGGPESAQSSDTPAQAYPSSGGSGAGVMFAAAAAVFVFSPLIFGTLYPIATGAALAAGLATERVLRVAAPGLEADGRLPIAMVAAVVVFWPVSRLDHRMAAGFAPYRIARHVVRVLLIAGYFTLVSLNPAPGLPRSGETVRAVMTSRYALPVFVVSAVLAHLLLTRTPRLRSVWDRALKAFRLRPSDLS